MMDREQGMEHQIFDAASHGKLFLIKDVLEKRPKSERAHLLSSKTAGATPLIAACRNGHYDVAEYLIKNCGADVELVGSVVFDGETIEGVPPLWCAAAAGHLNVAKLLVQNGANVNSTTKTNSTPLRAACFDGHLEIVQFLIQHGADFEIANRHGHTCLMISCYKNHYYIAKYLIQQGADINRKSVKTNTALHDCAESGALAIMKLLLSKGAKFEKDSYGMTPLMAASVAGHANIVEYLLSVPELVTIKEKIGALELLGATFVDNKKDMMGALGYWKRAMELRYRNGQLIYPKPQKMIPVYEGRKEVDNIEQLNQLISDPDEMRMQSLMVRERVLGPAHPDTSYYIRYRGAVYADAGQFDRCIALWMYALEMQQKILEPLSPLTQGSLLSFAELFWFMMGDKRSTFFPMPVLKFEDAFMVFSKAVHEVELAIEHKGTDKARDTTVFERLLIITLQICTILLTIEKTEDEEYRLKKATYHLVNMDPRGSSGWTLLHIVSSQLSSTVGRFSMKMFPSIQTIEFLASIGANFNARDKEGNTPLHVAAGYNTCTPELVKTLLRNGSHWDEVNKKQQVFQDISKDLAQIAVDVMPYLSLKCLAARVVSRYKIQGLLPTELRSFIDHH